MCGCVLILACFTGVFLCGRKSGNSSLLYNIYPIISCMLLERCVHSNPRGLFFMVVISMSTVMTRSTI